MSDLVEAYGDRVTPIALDVTDADQVNAAAGIADDVQLVVSNAGFAGQPDLFAEDLSASRQEVEVNYWGTLNVARAFVPVIKANQGGALAIPADHSDADAAADRVAARSAGLADPAVDIADRSIRRVLRGDCGKALPDRYSLARAYALIRPTGEMGVLEVKAWRPIAE